jgi:hypothetical protein
LREYFERVGTATLIESVWILLFALEVRAGTAPPLVLPADSVTNNIRAKGIKRIKFTF